MTLHKLALKVLPDVFAIHRLEPNAELPQDILKLRPIHVSLTLGETSIVCVEGAIPLQGKIEAGWKCIQIDAKLPFEMNGVLKSLADPLAEVGISIVAISTFDTDYVFVKKADLSNAVSKLTAAGHNFV